jgi:hypothetical protein
VRIAPTRPDPIADSVSVQRVSPPHAFAHVCRLKGCGLVWRLKIIVPDGKATVILTIRRTDTFPGSGGPKVVLATS